MTQPRHSFAPVMDHEIHVTEWGSRDKPALLMMHGLARTGRDFDELAAGLSQDWHVLCPDMIGRGLSSWSANGKDEYRVEYYAGVTSDLMDHFGIERAAWLGTSLGGQIGMHLASSLHADRITCLLLNDIGPEVPTAAIERVLSYAGDSPQFTSYAEAEIWLRRAYATFGPAAEGFWSRMTRSSLRRRDDGKLTLHYDPGILYQLVVAPDEMTRWDRWERIEVPCHLFRGGRSDLMPAKVAERMKQSGPKLGETVLPECGHAPTLSRPADITRVGEVLARLAW